MEKTNTSISYFTRSGVNCIYNQAGYFACGAGTPDNAPGSGGLYVPGASQHDGIAYFKVAPKLSAGLELTAGGTVSSTANGNLFLTPQGTGIVKVGSGTAYAFSSPVSGDLSVSGRLGVKGTAYFAAVDASSVSAGTLNATTTLSLNSSAGAGKQVISFSAANYDGGIYHITAAVINHYAPITGYGGAGNSWSFVSLANRASAYRPAGDLLDPTHFWFSRTAAATSTAQWFSRCHRVDHGVDNVGTGGQIHGVMNGYGVYVDRSTYLAAIAGEVPCHKLVTLSVVAAITDISYTPGEVVMGAAIRVSTQVAGLDNVNHHLKLTDATGAIVYIDIDCGIGTTIAANTKGHYHFGALAVAIEATAMKLEITGASGNIPNAGVVEVYILHRVTNDLASV